MKPLRTADQGRAIHSALRRIDHSVCFFPFLAQATRSGAAPVAAAATSHSLTVEINRSRSVGSPSAAPGHLSCASIALSVQGKQCLHGARKGGRPRELPDMMSASEGGHGKVDVVREVARFCSLNQFQMRARGEEVKKSENLADSISGSSLLHFLASLELPPSILITSGHSIAHPPIDLRPCCCCCHWERERGPPTRCQHYCWLCRRWSNHRPLPALAIFLGPP